VRSKNKVASPHRVRARRADELNIRLAASASGPSLRQLQLKLAPQNRNTLDPSQAY
jgi:hypothetical protein